MLSDIFSRWFAVRFFILAVVFLIAGLIVAFLLLFFGKINFGADQRDSKWFYNLAHGSFKRSVEVAAAGTESPPDLDSPGRVALGAQHYAQNCVRCHGAPGLGQNPMSLAMNPTPQHLPAVVDQFSDGGLFHILEHGVRMSGMPAWPAPGRADEVWSMVAFIRQLDEMTPGAYLEMVAPEPASGPEIAFGDTVEPRPMDFYLRTHPEEEHAYTVPAAGFSDYALAGVPVAQCTTCHGTDGSGAPTGGEAPNLTIQSPGYIAATLRAYATAQRESGYMQVVAAQLSDAQIEALSVYYGELLPDVPAPQADLPDPELVAAGETLANDGRLIAGVPSCTSCHNADGAGSSVMVPALAGQSAPFLERQLRQFRRGGRGHIADWNPMTGVAHGLEDDQITAIAAYYASLPPGTEPVEKEITPEQVALATDAISRVCSECHTESLQGVESGEYPNLTLQTGPYIQRSLYAFHTQDRENSRMIQTAGRLSEDEMDALGAYIGGLPMEPTLPAPDAPGDATLGAQIVEAGFPDRGVPACLSCHGPETTAAMPQLPRLHGQNANYILARLNHFQDQDLDARPINPMPAYAKQLSEDEIAATAAWFAEQEPLPKPGASDDAPPAQ